MELIAKRRECLLKEIELANARKDSAHAGRCIQRLHELDLIVECINGDGKAMKKLIEQIEASHGRIL